MFLLNRFIFERFCKKGMIKGEPNNSVGERALVQRFLDGDDEAFSVIYTTYVDELLSYGIGLGGDRETLKDIIHDIFTRLYYNKGYLKETRNLKAYLFRSLKNQLINFFKSQKFTLDIERENSEFSVTVTVLDQIINDEDRRVVQNEIEKYLSCLTGRQREAVYLRFIQELNYDEMAEIFDMTPHSVRKLISRAILRIRRQNASVGALIIFYIIRNL